MKKNVYVVTAYFKNYEEESYTDPSEEFLTDTYKEAQDLKAKLKEDLNYSEIVISEQPEEREVIL